MKKTTVVMPPIQNWDMGSQANYRQCKISNLSNFSPILAINYWYETFPINYFASFILSLSVAAITAWSFKKKGLIPISMRDSENATSVPDTVLMPVYS